MDKSPQHITKIQTFLQQIVEGDYAQIIVHEAVEALGNLDDENTVVLLERYRNSGKEIENMVVETCELTQALIKWNEETEKGKSEGIDLAKLRFRTNDPAPPFNHKSDAQYADVGKLTEMLLDDKNHTLFVRYRALFTLREIYTEESCEAICRTLKAENFNTCSPLLKHEVAFVLAQMENVFAVSVPYLLAACENSDEAAIVKHEALVAVGEMIDDESVISHLMEHKDPIVSESCAVALNNIRNRHAEKAEIEAKKIQWAEEEKKQ